MALDGVDAPAAELCRSLADAVDREPGGAALWGRYMDALDRLDAAAPDAEFERVMEMLREPPAGG